MPIKTRYFEIETRIKTWPVFYLKTGKMVGTIEHDDGGYLYFSCHQDKINLTAEMMYDLADVIDFFNQKRRRAILKDAKAALGVHEEAPDETPLMTIKQFCEQYPWPTESAVRSYAARRNENGFSNAFHKCGSRILVDSQEFFKVIKGKGREKKG